jgi:hypothetical protein
MSLIPLPTVQARLRPSTPLPWDVLNEKGHVLWSRGDIPSAAEFIGLGLGRNLYVDSLEVLTSATAACAKNEFFSRWAGWELRLSLLLRNSAQKNFLGKIREVADALVALAAFDADKVLFAVMRHDHSEFAAYGTVHSQHVAALCALLTQNMGWTPAARAELACAALTMNLSIVELQGVLAAGGGRLSASHRAQVRRHPEDSAALLARAGLGDGPWLTAVANHHERADGTGYPHQPVELDVPSQLIHLVDVFTAKQAARFDRQPVPADEAVRSLRHWPHPEAARLAALIGAYPPGCFVRTTQGEAGVVLRRAMPQGPGPVIAILQDGNRQALAVPTIQTGRSTEASILHALNDHALLVRMDPETLYSPQLLQHAV